jgi:ribosomal protein L32
LAEGNNLSSVRYQLEKNAKRAQFEADKLRRANKVRAEVEQARREIKTQTASIGKKALELVAAGDTLNAPLQEIADSILALQAEITRREVEIAAIKAEPWVPPPPPPPPPPKPPKPVAAQPTQSKPQTKVPPKREQVVSRLQFYIEAEDTLSKCPNCHAVTLPEASVCKHCGFRLSPPSP